MGSTKAQDERLTSKAVTPDSREEIPDSPIRPSSISLLCAQETMDGKANPTRMTVIFYHGEAIIGETCQRCGIKIFPSSTMQTHLQICDFKKAQYERQLAQLQRALGKMDGRRYG